MKRIIKVAAIAVPVTAAAITAAAVRRSRNIALLNDGFATLDTGEMEVSSTDDTSVDDTAGSNSNEDAAAHTAPGVTVTE